MSDERLRDSERRWRGTGSLADEARHLLERVRQGALAPRQLEVAALAGHPAARLARAGADELEPRGLPERGRRLADLLPEAGLRALLAATRALAPTWSDPVGAPTTPAGTVGAVDAWLASRSPGAGQALWPHLAITPTRQWFRTEATRRAHALSEAAGHLAAGAAQLAGVFQGLAVGEHVEEGLRLICELTRDAAAERRLADRVREEVAAWALGPESNLRGP